MPDKFSISHFVLQIFSLSVHQWNLLSSLSVRRARNIFFCIIQSIYVLCIAFNLLETKPYKGFGKASELFYCIREKQNLEMFWHWTNAFFVSVSCRKQFSIKIFEHPALIAIFSQFLEHWLVRSAWKIVEYRINWFYSFRFSVYFRFSDQNVNRFVSLIVSIT